MKTFNAGQMGVIASVIIFVMPSALSAQTTMPKDVNLLPKPAHIIVTSGSLPISSGFHVSLTGYTEPRLRSAAARLVQRLSLVTRKTGSRSVPLTIICNHAAHPDQSLLQEESYTLTITPRSARLTAPTPLGVLHGLETFSQLARHDGHGVSVPCVQIEDVPRFAWRGLMIDCVRHYQPIALLKGNLDRMAAVKMNVFHWHLTDDQSVRPKSILFPNLHPGGPGDQFYTMAQMKEIVAYANERGIRVVPEIEGPGHATALVHAYPQIAVAGQIDPTKEEAYRTMDALFGEMATVFPDKYVHTGGDEVNRAAWVSGPGIAAYMKDHGITDGSGLQAYYTQRIHDILRKHSKIMIGWNEIFTPTLPTDVTIQSWIGRDSLAEALHHGHKAILSQGYYLDHPLSEDFYQNDPEAGPTDALSPSERANLLGGEACMWTEQVTPETLDGRIWPRTAGLAERLWSPKDVTDEADLNRRMSALFSHTSDRHIALLSDPPYHPPVRREAPFHGVPSAIPGTVQSEDFDTGGEGLGYHVNNPFSMADFGGGSLYRPQDSPNVEDCEDTGRGHDIGFVRSGQWLRYTVTVQSAGEYTVGFRVASDGGGSFHLEDQSGKNLTGPVDAPSTGGWQTWTTVTAHVTLPAGRQTLTFVEDAGGYNINWLAFTEETARH